MKKDRHSAGLERDGDRALVLAVQKEDQETAAVAFQFEHTADRVTSPTEHRLVQPELVAELRQHAVVHRAAVGASVGRRAFLFLTTFRRTPTANAEGLDRVGRYHRKGLG